MGRAADAAVFEIDARMEIAPSICAWHARAPLLLFPRSLLSESSDARPRPSRRPFILQERKEGRIGLECPFLSLDHPNVNHEFMPDELFITKCRSDDVWEDTGAMHLMFACQFRMSWKIARRAVPRTVGRRGLCPAASSPPGETQ